MYQTHCPCDIDKRRFGIKGTEGVCCTTYAIMDDIIGASSFKPTLNATQSNATMFTAIEPQAVTINPAASSVCLAYSNPSQIETLIHN